MVVGIRTLKTSQGKERERERFNVGLDLLALVDAFVSWRLFSTNSGLGGAFERISE